MTQAGAALSIPRTGPFGADAPWARAIGLYIVAALALIALFFDAAASMATLWVTSSVYHHGLLVAPIALALILRSGDWRAIQPSGDLAGAGVVGLACALWLLGRAALVDLFGHAALVLAFIGAAIAIFGRALAFRWAFPLGFLFFMVPFGEELTPALQNAAAAVVAAALNATGVLTIRDGFLLTTAAGRFEMAPSCAGLRFLLASAMIATAVAPLAFADWKKRVAFLAAALAAALVANWLRAYVIILVATLTDRKIGVGPEHVALGWVLYSALLIALIAYAKRNADAVPDHAAPASANATAPSSLAALAGLAIAVAAAAFDAAVVSKPAGSTIATTPTIEAAGFGPATPISDWRAHASMADAFSTQSYRSPGAAVVVSLASVTPERKGVEIAGADVRAADGAEWRRILPPTGARRIETIADARGRKIDVATLYWLGDRLYSNAPALKRNAALLRLSGRPAAGGALFIAAPHDANADPKAAIGAFIEALRSPAPIQ